MVDAMGMRVAFDDVPGLREPFSFRVTPCCGAAATSSDPEFGVYCKACFEEVDPAYGAVPVGPLREVEA